MPAVDEFNLIARLFAPLAARHPGALGLTDDAALLECPPGRQMVLTADAMVAGVHFFPNDPPEMIARKLLRVNLSDLAAMGATPQAVLLTACFPQGVTHEWLDRFAGGLKTDLDEFSIALIGGDTVATPGPLTLSVTALGDVATGSALRRSSARSGDQIWVSGTIGDAAFGLFVAKGNAERLDRDSAAVLLDRYRLPRPRISLGQALVGVAHAAMDISDGLVGDLGHICKASGVGAIIEAAAVPLSAAGQAAVDAEIGYGLGTALSGGDDYELLFTAPPEAAQIIGDLQFSLGLRLTPIGRVVEHQGVIVQGADGRVLDLPKGGYRHFSA
jgi:thiamine-monophosphate kinase